MLAKVLDRVFLFICSREVLILLGALLLVLSFPMILEQWRFVRAYSDITDRSQAVEDIEGIVDGLAGILVAAGVFMESRQTIRAMATHGKVDDDPVEIRLNEVAHHNGMGLLLVGLFMEIGTLLIGLPARVIDVHAYERGIFGVCVAFSVIAVIILADFVKDYVLTYRMRRTTSGA